MGCKVQWVHCFQYIFKILTLRYDGSGCTESLNLTKPDVFGIRDQHLTLRPSVLCMGHEVTLVVEPGCWVLQILKPTFGYHSEPVSPTLCSPNLSPWDPAWCKHLLFILPRSFPSRILYLLLVYIWGIYHNVFPNIAFNDINMASLQLIMQQVLSQPITQQPVDPFMQQMAAHTHKNPVMHLLSQLHQVTPNPSTFQCWSLLYYELSI